MLDFITDLSFGQWMLLGGIFISVSFASDLICRVLRAIGFMSFLCKGKGGADDESVRK